MSIRTRIIATVAAGIVAMAVLGVYSIAQMSDMNDRVDRGRREAFVPLREITDLQQIGDASVQVGIMVLYGPREDLATNLASLTERVGVFNDRLDAFDASALDPESARLFHRAVVLSSSLTKFANTALGADLEVPDPTAPEATLEDAAGILTERAEALAGIRANLSVREEAATAAIRRASADARRNVAALLAVSLVLGAVVAAWLSTGIARRLRRVVEALEAVAAGDLTRRVDDAAHDELGHMGAALNGTLVRVQEAIAAIASSARSLAGSSEQLSAVSQQMAAGAEQTAAQAGAVSAAAEQVSSNIASVSTGAEEMGASIREIAKSTSDAARVAGDAVASAESTNTTVVRLGESSAEIGAVLKVITSIAEQTNLLALNATIEAARAGEAGKGFAVVANEVKELAKQTAEATEDIARKIAAIQDDAGGALSAITDIRAVIARVDEIQTTIASAVEEQSATTDEIARGVTEAAMGAGEIATNVTGVASAAADTTEAAAQTQVAAHALADLAGELEALVCRFRYEAEVEAAA